MLFRSVSSLDRDQQRIGSLSRDNACSLGPSSPLAPNHLQACLHPFFPHWESHSDEPAARPTSAFMPHAHNSVTRSLIADHDEVDKTDLTTTDARYIRN